jgi:hypothetical protein
VSSEGTHFLNVDLELITDGVLAPLLDHWSTEVVVLRNSIEESNRTAWLELKGQYESPEQVIVAFLDLVHALPVQVKLVWDVCSDRCFNVGIQSGVSPHSSVFSFSAGTLHQVAAVHARIDFTVYAVTSQPGRRPGG